MRALIVFMDTKNTSKGVVPAEPAEAAEGSAPYRRHLSWPAELGVPGREHFLDVRGVDVDGLTLNGYRVELVHDAEQLAFEGFRKELGERLRTLRGTRSRLDVALYMGRHPNTIAKFERGDVLPNAWELLRLSRLFSCEVQDLYGGVDHLTPLASQSTAAEFAMIPEYGVRASAGNGQLVDNEEIIGRFAFKRSWLASRGIKSENLAVVSADGDSMEPTVRDADILLVDTSVQTIRADGIYLIEQGGELRCKRLQAMVDGGVKIRSDNPRYETEVVPPDNAEMIRVVAKVIWIGGER